jgi:hypothetical protein
MAMSDSHNVIVLSAAPAGRFLEGILSGASKPGFGMEVVAATEPVGGRHTWRVFSGSTGKRKLIAILLENEMIGKGPEDEIATGQRIRMYCPIPGDELMVRVSATGTGTGDSLAIGDKLIITSGGDFIKTTGSPEAEPFEVMETVADVTAAGTLVHVQFTGN